MKQTRSNEMIEITNHTRLERAEKYLAKAQNARSKMDKKVWATKALAELNMITSLSFEVGNVPQLARQIVKS